MVRTLKNAFAADRIAQAFMLTGIRGHRQDHHGPHHRQGAEPHRPGRAGAAPRPTRAGVCQNCVAIHEGPPCRRGWKWTRRRISPACRNIRDAIIETVSYRAAQARYKIFIIDEVHMLSTSAFNALLKTLEEPPPHVKFLFATTEIRKVPVTVLSRCQRFDLRPDRTRGDDRASAQDRGAGKRADRRGCAGGWTPRRRSDRCADAMSPVGFRPSPTARAKTNRRSGARDRWFGGPGPGGSTCLRRSWAADAAGRFGTSGGRQYGRWRRPGGGAARPGRDHALAECHPRSRRRPPKEPTIAPEERARGPLASPTGSDAGADSDCGRCC